MSLLIFPPVIFRNPGVVGRTAEKDQGMTPDSAKRIAQDTMKLCVFALVIFAPRALLFPVGVELNTFWLSAAGAFVLRRVSGV